METVVSFFTEVSVRFSETDMFGHMNNVTPFIYFEEARIAYFKQRGMTAQNSETMTVVASQQCDYMRQVMPYENLRIYVKASAAGNASVTLHYLGENGWYAVLYRFRRYGSSVEEKRQSGQLDGAGERHSARLNG